MDGVAGTRRTWVLLGVAAAVMTAMTVVAPAADAQEPELVVTVEPAHDLVDGDWVTITVTGLPAGRAVEVAQCPTGAVNLFYYCDISDRVYQEADNDGIAQVQLRVDVILTAGAAGDADLRTTDCRAADACTVGVVERRSAVLTPAPLHFDPDAEPAPPPVLTLTPDSELEDLQTVTAEATGLVWSNRGYMVQCAADPTSIVDDCTRRNLVYFETTDGQVTREYQVDAVIETNTHGAVDCEVAGACVLVVAQDQLRTQSRTAIAPLMFGPVRGEEPPDGSGQPGTTTTTRPPDQTTTTVQPSHAPGTTTPESRGTPGHSSSSTTTTLGAGGAQSPATTAVSSSDGGSGRLPSTGAGVATLVGIGLAAVASGAGLNLATRRTAGG